MTRLIAEMAQSDSGAIFRLTSLRPVRPQNAPDPWERLSLLAFEAGAKEVVSIEPSERGELLRYMAPLLVEPPCMQCHAQQGYQVGQIRGGISVLSNPAHACCRPASPVLSVMPPLAFGAASKARIGWWIRPMLWVARCDNASSAR